jgi:integrase
MRGDGRLYQRKKSPYWWIKYYLRGECFEESTKETDLKRAQKYLRRRLQEMGADHLGLRKFVGPAGDRVSMNEVLDKLEHDYRRREKLSPPVVSRLKFLRAEFGTQMALTVTDEEIELFIDRMMTAGKSNATINRYTQILGQSFKLGKKLIGGQGPVIKRLEEDNVREGFFEYHEFELVWARLPEDLRDFAHWAYLTGWRKGEIASLTWDRFEIEARLMHLSRRDSKNKEARKIPLQGPLWDIIERRWNARRIRVKGKVILCPLVFFRVSGPGILAPWAPIREFRKAWKAACEAAYVPGRIFHDFRRTAARNLRRMGIPEEVAMQITGHKTVSMFRRYNITDEADLRDAVSKVGPYMEKLASEKSNVVEFKKS